MNLRQTGCPDLQGPDHVHFQGPQTARSTFARWRAARTRIVIHDVTWDVYESLIDSIGEGENCRVAFDGKDIEMMSIGPFHDLLKSSMDAFIAIVAGELAIEQLGPGGASRRPKRVDSFMSNPRTSRGG